ncbi:MAG: carboxylating nicotinate-nucleotide diphosphorylase [Planctomycetaceae bacterium]|nr:MAG: carboxylating nicotinate-nucleotide diphosphorylase [Planctomycetaceae bacterium]
MNIEANAIEIGAADLLIGMALHEDLMDQRDITSEALIAPDQIATVDAVARDSGVLAGLWIVPRVFQKIDPRVEVRLLSRDGEAVAAGTSIAEIHGPLRALLTGERTALNFLQHLCGVATQTQRYVAKIAGTRARILDTRKTLPGWRSLDKYAIRAGGGQNHRAGLYDQILIKDNHLAGWTAAGGGRSIAAAVARARSVFKDTPVEVEVESLEQLRDALRARPEIVLLDNMTCDQMRRGVALRDELAPGVALEASGGITLDSVRAVAETGVERISVGQLTHSAPAFDLAFDWAASPPAPIQHRPPSA